MPSLRQLNEAVIAFLDENPHDVITVVVDATFGHRIDPREVPEFDAAVENNELVSPPAGAIGRGDAFVLTIANKAKATILSNDSFQEFHAEFPWLFDDGRLIGGKPVPNIGWVFVARSPVRGPVSRRATRDAKKGRSESEPKSEPKSKSEPKKAAKPSKAASQPMPVPKTPPPKKAEPAPPPAKKTDAPSGSKPSAINDLLPFLDFVERHPVGSLVEATIDAYSSHGAYASAGSVKCYLPLRYLADPAPRSARDVVALGDHRPFVVVSFSPARRGVDVAVPGFQPASVVLLEPVGGPPAAKAPAKRASRAKKQAEAPAAEPAAETAAVEKAKRAAATKAATKKAATKKAPAKRVPAKKALAKAAKEPAKAPAKRPARKKSAEPALAPEPEPAAKKATRARKKAVATDG